MNKALGLGIVVLANIVLANNSDVLPSAFDLRNVDGKNYVSTVKSQSGGTCWTYGVMAAIESNLMLTGTWTQAGETGEANLAEYHLDWWNGFNRHMNADIAPTIGGLTVHQGGDYRVATAYFARGGGAVRDADGQSFSSAPKEMANTYHVYYVRDIEWLSVGNNLEKIDHLKSTLINGGVVGTALTWSTSFYSNNTFYQPKTSSADPNHAVAIVGWDDNKKTQAPNPGAWLAKNSWGSGWGDGGYFWISYHDKIAGNHTEMGAVSFRNVERLKYQHIYYHDYHGWRDTKKDVTEAFNAFKATGGSAYGRELGKSVSFYTAQDHVEYLVNVYDRFENGELKGMLSSKEGVIEKMGFHTVDLNYPVPLRPQEDFFVYVKLSNGGHAFDKTSNVPVLLGGQGKPIVESRAKANESYYRVANSWVDLTKENATANFCIKALSVYE